MEPLRVLLVDTARLLAPHASDGLAGSAWGPYACRSGDAAELATGRLEGVDAVVLAWDGRLPMPLPSLPALALHAAVLLVPSELPTPAEALRWLRLGAQEVLLPAALQGDALGCALRLAIERKRIEHDARKAASTDIGTGLPNQAQLLEHMNQLLALREREQAAMAVLVLRLEGLQTLQSQWGEATAQALRRKAAVRLRAGVRASDVVASLGPDAFAVLLSSLQSPADADVVADKLLAALRRPFPVGGQELAVASAGGLARHPADGRQAEPLLRCAMAQAALAPAAGRAGYANRLEAGERPAANDDALA